MKTRFLLLIIIVLVSFGCNNDENIMKNQNIEGQYLGFFERNGQSAEVQLSLENGLFKGNSNAQKPPAICNGNYSYNKNGNTIIFKIHVLDCTIRLVINFRRNLELQSKS